MTSKIGIRREDKNKWERRVPITPTHVKQLKQKHNIVTTLQPSDIRAYTNQEYQEAGAQIQEDLSTCPIVFAIKEIPIEFFQPKKTYAFFSHTIKGQKHNMPMLKKMMKLGCTLIDYEKIADKNGRRLVFFGRFAGLAGMVDTLWAYGQRLKTENIDTPLNEIKQTIHYHNLDEIKNHLTNIGNKIEKQGIPESISPLIIGFAGYGNVSQGAQEIIDLLPVKEIAPQNISSINDSKNNYVYKVVFKEEDMVTPISRNNKFDLQDYYKHPEKYQTQFEKYLPNLSILMNCIYWDARYPRLVTKKYIKNNYEPTKSQKLKVIGDISCDINGAIEFTMKETSPDKPVYVYNPQTDTIKEGYEDNGIVVMAVDNLPCELPRDSSQAFSDTLWSFIPNIMKADFSEEDFKNLELPFEIKNAVIVYQGKLTPNYTYINKYL